jgi:hypothetical protein
MAEFSQNEFEKMKNEAAQRVMEMYKGTGGKMPPYPDFISLPKTENFHEKKEKVQEQEGRIEPKTRQNNGSFLRYLNFAELTKNKDGLLLIGLILLLSSDGADDLLILALAYILL